QDVAALEIGAERRGQASAVHPERRHEHLGALHRHGRIVGRDQIGEQRNDDEPAQDDDRHQRRLAGRFDDGAEPARRRPSRYEPGVRGNAPHVLPPREGGLGGSMKAYRMPTNGLMPTIITPAMTTTPCTSGKSRWKMPS